MKAWKDWFLAKNPTAGHGKTPGNKGKGKGKAKRIKAANSATLLGEEMAKATARSPRSNRADCQIAEDIPDEVRQAIRETPIAEKQAELLKLAQGQDTDPC